jgi:hypothetical protein
MSEEISEVNLVLSSPLSLILQLIDVTMHCCWWDEDLDLCKPLNASQQGSTVFHAQVLKLCWCDYIGGAF